MGRSEARGALGAFLIWTRPKRNVACCHLWANQPTLLGGTSPTCPTWMVNLHVTYFSGPPGLPCGSDSRICLQRRKPEFDPWIGKIPWSGAWQPPPGKSHGQRSLVGYSPWGHKESDTTAQLTLHTSLSVVGRTVTKQYFSGSTSPVLLGPRTYQILLRV